MMEATMEIRKLRPAELYNFARILSASESWKTLMAVVPKEENENIPKFNTEHFVLIEQASRQKQKSAAEIFLEEWSTMGKRRPTLESTLNLLVKAQLFRAADYIAVDLLRGEPPKRPANGPAAQVDITDEEIKKLAKDTNFEYEMPSCATFIQDSLDSVLNDIGYPFELPVGGSKDGRVSETHQRIVTQTAAYNSLSDYESNSNDIELRSSELPAFVADIGRGTTSSAYGELRSSELPKFIAEICNRD